MSDQTALMEMDQWGTVSRVFYAINMVPMIRSNELHDVGNKISYVCKFWKDEGCQQAN